VNAVLNVMNLMHVAMNGMTNECFDEYNAYNDEFDDYNKCCDEFNICNE